MSMMSSDMAVPNFPVEHHSLWSSVNKNLGARNVSCSCSFKGDILPSCDTLWKFQSKFNLLVPKHGNHHRKVILSSSYTRVRTKSFRPHWAFFVSQPVTSPLEKDNDKTLNCIKSYYLFSKDMSDHPLVKSYFFSKDTNGANFKGSDLNIASLEREQLIEEPWLLHSSILSPSLARSTDSSSTTKSSDQSMLKVKKYFETEDVDSVETKLTSHSIFKFGPYAQSEDSPGPNNGGSDLSKTYSLRNQPVEEPWLIEPYPSQESDFMSSSSDNSVEDDKVNHELTNKELNFQLQQVNENILPEEESSTISEKELVPTSILINSSVCTMQRIAVLEDGKLVELLLEPVKDNVLCDSVYIGVVTKLVPHMGGAFVNIGSSRPSLMDIKNNREPFVFPPFHHSKEKEVNMTDEIEDSQIDDGIGQYSNDQYGEHDFDDDDVDIEPHKGHVNGSLNGLNVHNVEVSVNSISSSLSRSVESDLEEANKWGNVRKGTKVVVQVVKEGLGTKGPTLTAYPKLRSRFWVLSTRCSSIGISKKIIGVERTRLRVIAKTLQPQGFGLTARTVAAGHSLDELSKDLDGLISTWKEIMENAKSASLAAVEGVEGALPIILHRAMGQTLSVVQDYFNEKVHSMVVDSPRTYHEVTNYLQQIAPDLCDRVELYNNRPPLFDEYKIEEEISNMLSKWVSLDNGGYLVIEQTEALVSVDVNGGQCMLGQGTSQENAILDVNLAAAKQIAREIRLRDIGGIIVVDFIDMIDDANKRLVYEEVKKAVDRDRSTVKVSELSKNGLMEITRKRVRPSVTFMISEPCTCCHGTGRVEALETSFSKIEHEICRLHAMMDKKSDPEDPKSWPRFVLMVDRFMCNYLTSGKRTRLAILSSSLKVWILLKVARGFTRGAFEVKPLTSDKDNNTRKQVAINLLRPNTPSGKVTVYPVKKWKSGRN